jgi:SAM-dependent methyltransferase
MDGPAIATEPPPPDLAAIKSRQQAAWSSGDYAIVGSTLQIVGEALCETLDLKAGSKVLDVAAGNGMASLAAARRWCDVISTDYVPDLLERGKARAAADGWNIKFMEADAEELPFQADQFDVVLSTFGVMFTPNQDKAAAELLRVCKPKGKIGLANWTPDGFIGQMFKTLGKYLPPPAGARSPALWGTGLRLNETFEHKFSSHLPSPPETVESQTANKNVVRPSETVGLSYRAAYKYADILGQTPQEYEADGKAGEEIEQVYKFACKQINASTIKQETPHGRQAKSA